MFNTFVVDLNGRIVKSLALFPRPFCITGSTRSMISGRGQAPASNNSDIGTKALHKKHFLDIMKVLLGHARLNVVPERHCDQFEQHLIEHAGIVGTSISLDCLSYDDKNGVYYHSHTMCLNST